MEFYKELIPTWALSALINADYSGLEEEDITLVEEWLSTTGYSIVCCPNEEDECFFSSHPAFGLASDVIACWCN